jgi:hypothetical protein
LEAGATEGEQVNYRSLGSLALPTSARTPQVQEEPQRIALDIA